MISVFTKDLFFTSKIMETARQCHADARIFTDEKGLFESLDEAKRVILDLEFCGTGIIEKIRDRNEHIEILGYLPHVAAALRKEAEAKGCRTITRSHFTRNMADILTT